MSGGNEEVFPEVGHFVWALCQQGEHALDHQVRVLCHNLLVELDDVGQEGECLDLSPHEVHEDLFVEVWVRLLGGGGLEGDGGHDQGDELLHVVVNLLQRSDTTLDKVDIPAHL